jgi:nucleotide-binding universal stress UspA family protein
VPASGPMDLPEPLLSDERSHLPDEDYMDRSSEAFAKLQTLAEELHERHGVVVAYNVRPGHPAEAIIEEAKQRDATWW